MENYITQLQTLFRNKVLNAVGAERDFLTLLNDGDISKALDMMQDRHEDVDNAILEYNPQTHTVMGRRDKPRKNDEPYHPEKLPRARQRYINEVELFFLLGKDVDFRMLSEETDNEFQLFNRFISANRMHSLHRQWKRLAGAETEAAIVFHLYSDNGDIACKPFVACRSTGYDIRPLFDQYGNLLAFAYGYKVKRNVKTAERWEFLTPTMNFECERGDMGWIVTPRENLTGKINAIYARQPKAWDGAEQRIEREEMSDSKAADTNNYFADPVAYATADVVQLMGKEKENIGRLIQYTGAGSKFGYIEPPQDSASRASEMKALKESILFDTFTPDLSYDTIKGLGSLSGEAIKNSLVLGFIKRANRMEIYGELLDREVNVIKAILQVQHPEMHFDRLEIETVFQSPFDDFTDETNTVTLYNAGLMSTDTAVRKLNYTENPDEEVRKIQAQSKTE